MAKPDFDLMWSNFPDHVKYPSLDVLFNHIGGQLSRNVGLPGFSRNGNTCAVRMSRALNYGTMPLSRKVIAALGLHTLTGDDGKLYLFRVRELNTYLSNAIGITPQTITKGFSTSFSGTRGIVAFTVEGWSDATGHIALWDGTSYKEPTFDDFRALRDNPATTRREPRTTRMTLWPI